MRKTSTISQDDVTVLDPNTRIYSEQSTEPASSTKRNPNADKQALVLHGQREEEARSNPVTTNPFQAAQNTTDDSNVAFGNKFVPVVGSAKFAPQPNKPGEPPMNEDEKESYEAWLRSRDLIEREEFPKHEIWKERLGKMGQLEFSASIPVTEIPEDIFSRKFKANVVRRLSDQVAQNNKLDSFLGKTITPSKFDALPIYVPAIFQSTSDEEGSAVSKITTTAQQKEEAWLRTHAANPAFDEIEAMLVAADSNPKLHTSIMNPTKWRIAQGKFAVVSDHNGKADGKKVQLWRGLKPAPKTVDMGLAQVDGTVEYDLNINYLALPNNCTITRINSNEVGFCYNRETKKTEKMLPGRYMLQGANIFLGKAVVQFNGQTTSSVLAASKETDAFCDDIIKNLSILFVPINHVALIRSTQGTFALPHKQEPYVLNKREGFEFINCTTLGQAISKTTEAVSSYSIVTLQAGEYIIFKDSASAQPIVWEYDAENPQLNTVHLSNAYFSFNGKIFSNKTIEASVDQVTVFSKRIDQLVVIQDNLGNIRFLEDSGNQPITLRAPWRYVDTVAKSEANYSVGEDGAKVCRIQPSEAEWVAVVSQKGKFEMFPPTLDEVPYYFYQPRYTVVGIVNINQEGAQELIVPRIGKVSVVNLTTGNIGACKINNAFCFLNPSPHPQIFVSPNKYIQEISMTESYVKFGDLHRIYLKPDERCVVVKNGIPILLPGTPIPTEFGVEAEVENGIYTFRAERLEVYGPRKKSEKEYDLGPYHFFRVGVGEVGYGNINGELHIWGQGQHSVDVNKNERFSGFFQISADPLKIERQQVTSLHGIRSHLDIVVTYSIEHPELAIRQFKSHDLLHGHIETTTRAEILHLCKSRLPIGYACDDFETQKNAEQEEEEIENQFTTHTSESLAKYGVKLGSIQIQGWEIDPEFAKQSMEISLQLQRTRSELEQAKIALRQQEVDNQSQLLDAERQKQMAITQAQTKADIQAAESIASARATAGIAEANARAESVKSISESEKLAGVAAAEMKIRLTKQQTDLEFQLAQQKAKSAAEVVQAESNTRVAQEKIKTIQAEQEELRVKIKMEAETAQLRAELEKKTAGLNVETEVFKETAREIAKAQAANQIAQAQFNSAELEAKRMTLLAEAEAARITILGKANATVKKAEIGALYSDPSSEQMVRLETKKIDAATELERARHVTLDTQISAIDGVRKAMGYPDNLGFNPGNPFGAGVFGGNARVVVVEQPANNIALEQTHSS
ncbi:MAG: hypothetical protein A3E82_04765 [Gammaproteobacteria bacterium RIFCSPHIGHO2_12_FULL_38_11]|nr:MAG: hypothetical protein A3E82_04765 [Gammaproteobacteria bacterium RIFCSPHIGHO2_12_FULL_38_11]